MQKLLLLGCLFIHLCLMSSFVNAINFAGKHGAVMARTVLLDESGRPILVEYDETGNEVGGPIGYEGEFSKLSIIPASLYEQEQLRLKKFDELYENTLKTDAKVMSRETFLQGSYPTADGKSTMTFSEVGNKVKGTITRQEVGATTADFPLPSYVKSVYVRGRSYRIEPKPEQLVLLSFSVDLSKQASFEGKKALLMDEKGEIIHQSEYNIAPRVGFFGDPSKKQEYGIRKNEDEIFGPVKNVMIFIEPSVFPGSVAWADTDGKYSMKFFLPYCPGGMEFTTDLWAQLFYRNFNPNGQMLSHYYLRRQDWTGCFDPFPMYGPTLGAQMAYVNALAIKAAMAVPFYNADFRVDVMFLTGRFLMRNPDGSVIEVTDKTEYEAEEFDESDPANWVTQDHYDFDNDGKDDDVELGIMEEKPQEDGTTKQVFSKKSSEEIQQLAPGKALQAVYFSSNTEQPVAGQEREPDLIRVADTRPKQKQSDGLLKTISEEDLRKTDIYVFRESTGELVLERNGLTEAEVSELDEEDPRRQLSRDTGVAKDEQYFYYRLMLRGRHDYDLNIGGGLTRTHYNPDPSVPQGWESWAQTYQLAEPFQKREADHLRSGEWIRIVAINRMTGYVGTQRVQLSDASQNKENMLNIKLEDTYLEPPNLKVWAQRKYKNDKGMLKNIDEEKERHNIIGQEGVALTSDTYIEVFTEWLDADGRPLPEGLGIGDGKDFGLTGRLARSAGGNTLIAAGSSDLDNFPIPPGRNIQVLKISDNLTTPEHFYVHVNGSGMAQEGPKPQFEDYNTAEGLAGRPKYFTPFLTPVFDEEDTWQTWNAYRGIKRDRAEEENPDPEGEPAKPLPSYVWKYRPEYQFSQYDLEVAEINRITETESGSEEKTNILNANTPVVASTDKLIEILYSLTNPTNDRISPIEGPQDLVFAFGEEEVRVTFGADKQIRFENIEHLASLTPEDFLSIRLYSNQDAGNILWEYAFEHLVLDTQLAGYDANAGRTLYVSADDPIVPLQARLLGYADRSEEVKTPITVLWSASGASLESTSETDNDQGVFFNEVELPPVTGATTHVEIKLVGVDETRAKLPKFEVVPGVPDQISVEQSDGNLSVGGLGQRTLTFTVRDKNNNLVADGTGVSFFPEGSLLTVSADTATSNGRASVTIKGGDYAEPAKLVFTVGDKTQLVQLDVRPLNVAMSAPASLEAGKSANVTVTVTDQDGQPAAGVDVSLGSTYGYLQATELTTDSNGKVTTTVTAPGSQGTGEITAQVLRTSLERRSFSVNYSNPEDRDLEVANAALIGDRTGTGTFTYDRFDSAAVNVSYEATAPIQVKGSVGEQITVTLGDSHDPNLAPIATYFFNQVDENTLEDDGGRFPLKGMQVSQQKSARLGAGNSMSFAPDASKAWGDGLSAIGLPQSTGFTLEVFPKGDAGGVLVNLGQGGQRLSYSNMRFTYSVHTEEGDFAVTSEPIFPARWHQVSARYHQGKLQLSVNDQHYETAATGAIEYNWSGNSSGNDDPGANHDLEIAGEFNGYLDNLKWFNWASSPVVTFADGSTQKTVTLSAATETLTLNSTGRLHESGAQTSLHRVAVYTDKVHQYASLVSLDAYKAIAGMHSEGTPLDQQTAALPLNFLFPQAHAWGVMDALSWLFPIQEINAVLEQLTYAVTDPDKFEADVFIVNLIVAATYLPPGRVLQPFARTLGVLFKTLKGVNPKFLKYFGGMFSGVVSRAKKGQFDILWHMIPFFIVMAEMYNDEEARKGLEFLFKTVDSGEDILSLVEYIALPAEGWDGDGEIPEVALFEAEQPELPMGWMMNQAYAQKVNVKRIVGATFGKTLAKAVKLIGAEDAKHLPDALKVIRESLTGPGAKAIAGHLFSLSTLSAAVKLHAKAGARSLRNFAKGNSNARYPFPIVAATIGYLGWEMTCGALKDGTASEEDQAAAANLECGDKGLNGQVSEIVVKKLGIVFSDAATGANLKEEPPQDDEEINLNISPNGHGALFHLVQTAYFQLNHRAGGLPIKFMERQRLVVIKKDNQNIEGGVNLAQACKNKQSSCIDFKKRNVDIILGEGAVEKINGDYVAAGSAEDPETWVELKSWEAKSESSREEFANEFAYGEKVPWAVFGTSPQRTEKKDDSVHKQFSLDRAAKTITYAFLTYKESQSEQSNTKQRVGDFYWRFQKFKVKNKSGNVSQISPKVSADSTKFSQLVRKRPDVKGKSQTERDSIQDNSFGPNVSQSSKIKTSGSGDVINLLVQKGFSELSELAIDEPVD